MCPLRTYSLIWSSLDWGWEGLGQEEKGTTEDEMAGWHHRLSGHGFEYTVGVGDGQGGLACCGSWGCKESDTTERLNWTELRLGLSAQLPASRSPNPGPHFCYLKSSVLPHSGLPLGSWLISWLLLVTCPVRAEQGVPAIAPVLMNTLHIQAALFLIGNFWHLCHGLALIDLRADWPRDEHCNTFALMPLNIKCNSPCLNESRVIGRGGKLFPSSLSVLWLV